MGALGTARSFMSIVKEIDFDEVRDRAETPPRILTVSASPEDASALSRRVLGEHGAAGVSTRAVDDLDGVNPQRFDVIIVDDPNQSGVLEEVRTAFRAHTSNVFFLPKGEDEDEELNALRMEIVTSYQDLAPSFGRHYEPFREAAVRSIVDGTARANGQFAFVSNVPAVIPVLGNMIAAGADLVVLTKNQVMMCYKLAAAHNRDLGNQTKIMQELVPVIGAGFLWRTLARQAASWMPAVLGTVPKVVIAFIGTFAIGRSVDYFYKFGSKPSKGQVRSFIDAAAERAKQMNLPGTNRDEAAEREARRAAEAAVNESGQERSA